MRKLNTFKSFGCVLGLCLITACGTEDVSSGETLATSSDEYEPPKYVVPSQPAVEVSSEQVSIFDVSGWLVQPPFYAAGEEPYWRLDLEDDWFVFKRTGLPEIEAPFVEPVQENGRDLFQTEAFVLSLSLAECEDAPNTDGIVGSAELIFEDVVFLGCIHKRDSHETVQPDGELDEPQDATQ